MAKKATRRISSYDQHIALRVRDRRKELGLSQTEVADALRVTFQQIQKYERATNRIAAGRLWLIAKFFKVPVGYFFEGLR